MKQKRFLFYAFECHANSYIYIFSLFFIVGNTIYVTRHRLKTKNSVYILNFKLKMKTTGNMIQITVRYKIHCTQNIMFI